MSFKVSTLLKMMTPPLPTPEERETPALIEDLIFAGLRVSDERLNAIAAELVRRLGRHLVPRMVLEASNPKTGPKHRVRLLRAIEHTGAAPDAGDWFVLMALTGDKNAAVRDAAADLIVILQDRRFREARTDDAPGAPPAISGC